MVYPIKLNSPEDAVRLSDTVAQSDVAAKVTFGTATFDARSLLGLFTLIGKDAMLVAPDHTNPNHFIRLLKKLDAFA